MHDSTEQSRVLAARTFAAFVGLLVSGFVLSLSTIQLVRSAADLNTVPSLGLTLLAVAFATMVSYSFTRFLALAYVVSLLRGPGSVAWCAPGRCRPSTWVAFDWRFNSDGGLQQGERYLGLEVALVGRLA